MIVVLFEPEIPPNTGNVARLCAAFGVELHLIEPLGFSLENRYLRRAGLDYWPNVRLSVWPSFSSFLERPDAPSGQRLVMASSKARIPLSQIRFAPQDALIFGPETRGLPENILDMAHFCARIPTRTMNAGGVRSLNLSTACGIFLYTALADCAMLENNAEFG